MTFRVTDLDVLIFYGVITAIAAVLIIRNDRSLTRTTPTPAQERAVRQAFDDWMALAEATREPRPDMDEFEQEFQR